LGEKYELSGQNKKNILISGLLVAFITFFMALLVSLGSEALVRAVNNVLVAFILLLVIIFLGIFFDIVGTAATAAELAPFNARAAKKIFGAKQGVKMIHNADIVANVCNDVIGDIAGTLSGAIGAGIVITLVGQLPINDVVLAGSAMTSLIAALTVGGKAMGKKIAVNNADSIIFQAAKVVAWLEELSGWELFRNRK
jgi:Mg2+/Co2+ transporter CorB